MKKVLIIGPFPNPINGCSLANQVLLTNLKSRKVSVDIINTASNYISSKQGTEFSFFKVLNFLKTYIHVPKIFASQVIYTTPGQTFFGILKYAPFYILCILLRKPYIIHVHGNYLGKEYSRLNGIKRRVFRYLLRKASAGIVLSESLRSNFDGLLMNDKIFVIKNFVQNDLFSIKPFTKQKDKLRLLYLSNVMVEKGIFELLKSLKLLKEKNIDFELVIAGRIEKEIEEKFKNIIDEFGDNVKYLGTVFGTKKKEILEKSNVFILPTYYSMEGQPISILEGLATGNIIVSTNHGGIPDIISNVNGFLVEPKSVIELADVLIKINDQLSFFIDIFSKQNIESAKENYTEDSFTVKILSVINGLSKIK